MPLVLSVERSVAPSGELSVRLGHHLLDDYLVFLAGRVRPNSLLAAAFDLKVFFSVVHKEPAEVTSADVIDFITSPARPSSQFKGGADLRRWFGPVGSDGGPTVVFDLGPLRLSDREGRHRCAWVARAEGAHHPSSQTQRRTGGSAAAESAAPAPHLGAR